MVTNWPSKRSGDRETERRARQVKEIVRLAAALRAEMGLENILKQVVEALSGATGFNVAALNLVQNDSPYVEVVASAGLNEQEHARLVKNPPQLARLLSVMRAEFCISRSYFISHNYKHLLEGVQGVTLYAPTLPNMQRSPDTWHPEDVLFVPLISPREDKLLGILSLDQPEDNKIPTLETVEIIEMYATLTSMAIDTSRLFEEREAERRALESQLFILLFHLEQVRQGNLDVHVQVGGAALSLMADSLNAVIHTLNGLLIDVRSATETLNHNVAEMRDAATMLTSAAQSQMGQIRQAASDVDELAQSVRAIATIAGEVSAVAHEASEISQVGREAAEQAYDGMSAVREMAIQTVKKMKRLGESSQEISEIAQMVADFTSQTNLLALNAAIEAARAGENGRGFAVVAQEIRNLSTNSAEATRQIHTHIKSIQTETVSVVGAIEHSTQQIVLQSELTAQAGSALQAVDTVTQRITHSIAQMNTTATSQADRAAIIAHSMARVAEVTEQTNESVEHMRASLERLVEVAQRLHEAVGVFRLGTPGNGLAPALLPAAPIPTSEQATQPMPTLGASPRDPATWGAFGSPINPQTGSFAPINPQTGSFTPINPQTGSFAPINPQTGSFTPINPQTGSFTPINPQTGSFTPINPQTGSFAPVTSNNLAGGFGPPASNSLPPNTPSGAPASWPQPTPSWPQPTPSGPLPPPNVSKGNPTSMLPRSNAPVHPSRQPQSPLQSPPPPYPAPQPSRQSGPLGANPSARQNDRTTVRIERTSGPLTPPAPPATPSYPPYPQYQPPTGPSSSGAYPAPPAYPTDPQRARTRPSGDPNTNG